MDTGNEYGKDLEDLKYVSIKHHDIDGSLMSYEIKGIRQGRGIENPLYMYLKEIESVTTTPTKFAFFERIKNVFIHK